MSENASWDDYNVTGTSTDEGEPEVSPSTSPLAYAADGYASDGDSYSGLADSWGDQAATDAAAGYDSYVPGDLANEETDAGIASSSYSSAAGDEQSAISAGPLDPPGSQSGEEATVASEPSVASEPEVTSEPSASSDTGESDVATVSS